MSLDEELTKMDLVEVKKYKADETLKAFVSGTASLLGFTTIPGIFIGGVGGAVAGGLGGLVLGITTGNPGTATAMCALGALYCALPGAYAGGAVAYLAGWIYTGAKVYNIYQAHKREIELEYGQKK